MTINARKFLTLILLILISAAAFFWLRSYVFSNIGAGLNKRIQSLKLRGLNLHYDSLSIQWFRNVVEIDHLVLEKNAYDTSCVYPEFIAVGKVRAEGFRLLPLIFRNIVSFERVYLDEARIVMRQNSLLWLDSTSQRENEFTLRVDELHMKAAEFTYTDSVECKMIKGIKTHLTLSDLELEFHPDRPFEYNAESLTLDSAHIKLPNDFYTFEIMHAKLEFDNQALHVDSIRIIPELAKIEFGKKFGHEVDRFEGLIPFVKADGFSFSGVDSIRITARVAEVQFYLKVFRDKRLRFVKKVKLLPMAQLEDLPFALSIDSLKVTKSYVQYEEIVAGSPDPGQVDFDNVYAVFTNVDNRNKTGNALLTARGTLLGQGDIKVFVNFPYDRKKRSSLAGSIKNFSIPKINSMLTPSTNIKVESGALKELLFNFSFNSVRSDGEIELNYEDLKLVTFKEEDNDKDSEPQKDNLKTFMMNTFVFRKNMDENVPEEKRKGTIMYIRDDSRSIFNFWVKSLVSGIKSAYDLDKAEAKKSERADKKEERNEKKEERLSKREMKKAKKAEKKKERG
jgi:hypothetical protein